AGDGADHAFIQVDMLDFDIGDLDAPGVGLRIQDVLYVDVELLAFGQHLVELVLAQHGAQRGLRKLARRFEITLYLYDCLFGCHDSKINDRVHLDRHVIPGNDVLAWHIHGHHAQIHPHHLLQHRYDEHQARALDAGEPAQGEHHPALIFAQDLDGIE